MTESISRRLAVSISFSRKGRVRCVGRNFGRCGNDGQDTRAIQQYLGHRNIQHTTRYTDLAPNRFKDFWQD